MVIVDTSAWIEYFRGGIPRIVNKVDQCLELDLVGFGIAEKSTANYRLLRSRGITVRKTIDVLIGTFCAEHGLRLIHHDSDFKLMAKHIGLDII